MKSKPGLLSIEVVTNWTKQGREDLDRTKADGRGRMGQTNFYICHCILCMQLFLYLLSNRAYGNCQLSHIFSLDAISKQSCCSLLVLVESRSCSMWLFSLQELQKSNIAVKSIPKNLVDLIWTKDRPALSNATIYPLELKFTGQWTALLVALSRN